MQHGPSVVVRMLDVAIKASGPRAIGRVRVSGAMGRALALMPFQQVRWRGHGRGGL